MQCPVHCPLARPLTTGPRVARPLRCHDEIPVVLDIAPIWQLIRSDLVEFVREFHRVPLD
jgi:hypothetical protein